MDRQLQTQLALEKAIELRHAEFSKTVIALMQKQKAMGVGLKAYKEIIEHSNIEVGQFILITGREELASVVVAEDFERFNIAAFIVYVLKENNKLSSYKYLYIMQSRYDNTFKVEKALHVIGIASELLRRHLDDADCVAIKTSNMLSIRRTYRQIYSQTRVIINTAVSGSVLKQLLSECALVEKIDDSEFIVTSQVKLGAEADSAIAKISSTAKIRVVGRTELYPTRVNEVVITRQYNAYSSTTEVLEEQRVSRNKFYSELQFINNEAGNIILTKKLGASKLV